MRFLIDMPLSPELSAWLARVIETIPQGELPNSIVVIEKARIRRRRLPVEPSD